MVTSTFQTKKNLRDCGNCDNYKPKIILRADDFDKFLKHTRIASDCADKFEKKVSSFIRSEWNTELELCVELEDTGLLTIFVGEEIDKVSFYQFIIKPLCNRYALRLAYTETVIGDSNYVEYGLRKIKENTLE